jgi:hypothetical protein
MSSLLYVLILGGGFPVLFDAVNNGSLFLEIFSVVFLAWPITAVT